MSAADAAVRRGNGRGPRGDRPELCVVPDRRGQGLGRALVEAAIELARREGAASMDLGTSEDDLGARPSTRASASSTARSPPDDGPVSFYYEREL